MNLSGYVWRDLLRNPRRTLSSGAGVIVGVGLFAAVLFFIDGSGASMTRRAVAPLTLDIQRVLTAPLGGGVRFEQKLGDEELAAGETTRVTLTVTNDGLAPAHEVVVRYRPNAAWTYAPGSTSLDGAAVQDVDGSPLFQGDAGTGLNVGTVAPDESHQITYEVHAVQSVSRAADLQVQATISSREEVAPRLANEPAATSLAVLAERVGRIPGVISADPLVFVDMDPGAISANELSVPGPVKLFAFDAEYQSRYPSINVLSGDIRTNGVLISAETARTLKVAPGETVTLNLPGDARPLTLEVSGITDLSGARPLFESREGSTFEKFKYMPYSIVIDPGVYREQVEPAFEVAAASRESTINSLPVEELDVAVDRKTLNSDPASALAQTRAIAEAISAIAPNQDYLIDNISNALGVARGDAEIGKRMFVFLGVPGAILAAILTVYAGNLLAEAARRESALLRVRGATRGHLRELLLLRTITIAGLGALLGTALGFAAVLALLGPDILFEASAGALVQSALIAIGGGMLVTALALYVPGRRLITQEIKQELAVLPRRAIPTWRRLHLDLVALVAAVIAQVIALRVGAFDAPAGSVFEGRSVSLPLHLLVAPIVAWLAGTLLIVRILYWIAARAASKRDAPHFTRLLPGVLWRSISRRLGALSGGVVTLGLVVGLGTMLLCFSTVYAEAQRVDARFLVGSDIRLTPNPTSGAAHPIGLTRELGVSGVQGATAVVYSPENAVLTSDFNEDVATLAAIDPRHFGAVGALQDSLFIEGSASRMMSRMQDQPDGVLVNVALADGLKLKAGDQAHVLFGRDTDQQTRSAVTILGLFTSFPGAPKGTDLVANLEFYERLTGLSEADYYLVEAADDSGSGLRRAVASLSVLPGFVERFEVQTSETALDRDQSSLTALNVRGLLQLDSFFTFLMAATATAMFVFGLIMHRRREYVTMRAQGMQSREIRWLVLAESGISAIFGITIGLLVGLGMATQFVQVLRPIFTLAPPMQVPVFELSLLVALVLGASVLSSAAAAVLIGRLKPTELLRDE